MPRVLDAKEPHYIATCLGPKGTTVFISSLFRVTSYIYICFNKLTSTIIIW